MGSSTAVGWVDSAKKSFKVLRVPVPGAKTSPEGVLGNCTSVLLAEGAKGKPASLIRMPQKVFFACVTRKDGPMGWC